jgi:hypothetical protein
MKIRWAAGVCLFLAVLLVTGCGSITQLGSSNMGPMIEQFPYQASQPIARELRYTYMSRVMLDGKEHKRIIAADDATRVQGSLASPPAAVLTSATAPSSRVSDDISRQAREAEKRGADRKIVAAIHGQAVAAGGTEAALGRAEAAAGVGVAFTNFISAVAGAGQWLTDSQAARLGEWVRRDTGAIGPAAPAGSVLQLDFIYVNTGKAYGTDSVTDILVHATLQDGRGRTLESRQGFQLYTYMGKSTIEIPSDAVGIQPGVVAPGKRHLMKDFASDPFSPQLAVAASSALADLYRQARAK